MAGVCGTLGGLFDILGEDAEEGGGGGRFLDVWDEDQEGRLGACGMPSTPRAFSDSEAVECYPSSSIKPACSLYTWHYSLRWSLRFESNG